MSRTFAIFLILFVGAAGGGIAWFYLRPRPSELDVAARPFPDLPPIKVSAGDWPWWRGPGLDNHSPDASAPTVWNETTNIVWKKPIPGRGHSTPILVGNRVFATSADEMAERQFVIALDRETGAPLWQTTVHEKNFIKMHADNSHASSTPASDGERLFVAFANNRAIHVTALDFNGRILWRREAGGHAADGISSHGYGSSLALWGPYVYVSDDSPSRGWIAALNRETGEIGWRSTRRTGMGSYGSPLVAELDGKPTVLLAGNGNVTSYDAKDGHVLWVRAGLGEVTANTVTIGANMVFASSGYQERNLLALKADGTLAWKKEKKSEVPYPPSMLWNDGYLYVVGDNEGFASCYKAETGEQKWKERLGGSYYSSPLLVGKQIYACDRDGDTKIFEASPDGPTIVARNKLDGSISASPVAVGGKLFIRTQSHLYCIGKK
jgi:outer membrane protein assembly factor BamB